MFRTAQSRGIVDLLAIKEGQLLLIQAKVSGNLPTRDWNNVYDLAALLPGVGVPLLVERKRGVKFWRLTARKTQRGRRPMVPFLFDYAA